MGEYRIEGYDSRGFRVSRPGKFFYNQARELLESAVSVDGLGQEGLDLVNPLEWNCPASSGQVSLLAMRLKNIASIEGIIS